MARKISRRDFVKKASLATSGLALGATAFSAKSYSNILGANERMNFAVIGLHGRGNGHLAAIADCDNTLISHICDVDKRDLDKFSTAVERRFGQKPVAEKDIRIMLEDKNIDAICIATPEHWHAPMTIMGLQAGKHVFVEKPCSHNPREGELMIQAQKKYGKAVQMGNQQRSSAHTIKIMKQIHEGLIGEVYMGKAWYSNTRGGIGIGKKVPVPDYLDWELWQGPAPRRPYKDNVHPYNWHWFWHWGTGETLNNGTHEVDLCRWALQVDYPNKVSATGGRYHFKDDWEFYDTIITNFEYDDKFISWEGKSCQGMQFFNRGRGATIHGTKGTVLLDRGGYLVYDPSMKVVDKYSVGQTETVQDLIGAGDMTTEHFKNFINAIKSGAKLNAPIEDGNISVTILQLSNIAWKHGCQLEINPKSGRILNNEKAMQMWSREYEPGWDLKI